MNLKRIAEELDTIGNDQEDKELEETLAACGLTADDDGDSDDIFADDDGDDDDGIVEASADEDAELMAMVASIDRESAVKDDFVVEGISGDTQDEFDQVAGVTENGGGQADFGSVADAAKRLASIARRLATVKEAIVAKKEVSRYASHVAALEKAIVRKASVIRKALADKTTFSGDLGHDGPRPEKEYGAYDMSEGEEAFTKRDMGKTEWKDDSHDEVGFGVPKKDSDIPKLASIKVAANKAVRLAVCLLGNKAPEDVVEAQGRDFFASMDAVALERALKRYADTAELYDNDDDKEIPEATEEVAAAISTTEPVEVAPQAGDVKTVEQAACEISAAAVAPVEEAVPEVKEEVAKTEVPAEDAPFNGDEEKEIQAMIAHIKSRKAKIAAEAARRVAEELPVVEETVEDEVVEAKADPVVEAPEADFGDEAAGDEIELSAATDEADAVVEPELEGLFGDEDKVASTSKKPSRCAQKIPAPKLASVEADDLSQLWADAGEEVFK